MIKIGDVVKLKSSGPDMTVNKINSTTQELQCMWFSGEHFDKVESYYFSHDSLQLVEINP